MFISLNVCEHLSGRYINHRLHYVFNFDVMYVLPSYGVVENVCEHFFFHITIK